MKVYHIKKKELIEVKEPVEVLGNLVFEDLEGAKYHETEVLYLMDIYDIISNLELQNKVLKYL